MEKGGGQTHSQVHGCHLVLFHQVDHVIEKTQQRLQDLPALVGQQQDGSLGRLQPLLLGDICGKVGAGSRVGQPKNQPAGRQ